MTRAELTTLLSKFAPGEINGVQSFKDVKGHWAEKYLGYAVSKGWIKGYEDNSFRPDEEITRAEFVSIINNVLERHTKIENMTLDKKEYKDLDKNKWYYEDIEEASNSHKHKREDGQEKWIELTSFDIEM